MRIEHSAGEMAGDNKRSITYTAKKTSNRFSLGFAIFPWNSQPDALLRSHALSKATVAKAKAGFSHCHICGGPLQHAAYMAAAMG